MFLQVDNESNQKQFEVCFEQNKYIRRNDDNVFLHTHDYDHFIDWSDSSDLGRSFEFTIEEDTRCLKTHHGFYIIWSSDHGCLMYVPNMDDRAITVLEPTLTRTFAKSFESIVPKREASPIMKALQLFYKEMDSSVFENNPHLTTKRERRKVIGSMWKQLSNDEKQQWVQKML